MTQEIVCVVAGQRSGTNAFRSILAGTERFADFREIFDTNLSNTPSSYFAFCRSRPTQLASINSANLTEAFCDDYIAHLRTLAGDRHLLIDVKFNSWGNLRSPWMYIHQEPYFLAHLKRSGAILVMIVREDIVGQILSDWIARAIRKWVNLENTDVKSPLLLDVPAIENHARLHCLSESFFYAALASYERSLFLTYETLFSVAGLAEAVEGQIRAMVGEPLRFAGTHHRTNRLAKEAAVANYDEVCLAVRRMAEVYRTLRFQNGALVSG